jgi:type IV pilus assembly protein PilB
MFKHNNQIDAKQVAATSNALKALDGEAAVNPLENELSDLWQPDADIKNGAGLAPEMRLIEQGRISTEQLEQARSIHDKTPRKRLGQILLDMGVVQEADLLACVAEQYELPFVRITSNMVDQEAYELLDSEFIESQNVLPIAVEDGKLVVVTTDPTNVFLLDEVQRKTRMQLVIRVCPSEDIKTIVQSMQDTGVDYEVDELIQDISEEDIEIINDEVDDVDDLEKAAGDSPIIKFVNYVVANAVKEGASDIHMEPCEKKFKIRFRVDGVLFEGVTAPYHMHAAVVSRIKIMANMDIAERRLPQDGRIRVRIHKRDVDMRVSTLPTSHGEKVVIRIMDIGRTKITLTDLGMDENNLEIIKSQIAQPHGIILVTGPTGSGKSTTLYSCLRCMDLNKLNISTVEDPVEFQLDGVSQVQVHERIGMTFATALRSLLRQDPDVVMIGEIRDQETAHIAVQASLTGHLVLSTLHTNDAPSSITRLINIGIEPFLIAASTNGVMAQRLVRRICQNCKEPYTPTSESASYLELFGFDTSSLLHGKGCDRCRHTGFDGRIGLYELLIVDDTYRDIITKSPTVTELRRLCRERGMVSLRDDGFHKVQAGLTTVEEVMRVTESTI